VAFYVAVSSIPYWWGGYAVGPRYLIPVLPFLTLPIIFVLDRIHTWAPRALIFASISVSVLAVWSETISHNKGGFPPANISNPLFSWSLPGLLRGDIRFSLGTFLVGPFAGTGTLLTLLPLPVFLGLWSWYCARRRRVTTLARAALPVSG
jgi:hypothetical protein